MERQDVNVTDVVFDEGLGFGPAGENVVVSATELAVEYISKQANEIGRNRNS